MTITKTPIKYPKMDASPSVQLAVREAAPDQKVHVAFQLERVEAALSELEGVTIHSRVWTSKWTRFTGVTTVQMLANFERDDSVISYTVTGFE